MTRLGRLAVLGCAALIISSIPTVLAGVVPFSLHDTTGPDGADHALAINGVSSGSVVVPGADIFTGSGSLLFASGDPAAVPISFPAGAWTLAWEDVGTLPGSDPHCPDAATHEGLWVSIGVWDGQTFTRRSAETDVADDGIGPLDAFCEGSYSIDGEAFSIQVGDRLALQIRNPAVGAPIQIDLTSATLDTVDHSPGYPTPSIGTLSLLSAGGLMVAAVVRLRRA